MRSPFCAPLFAALLAACTPAQVQTAQADQAAVQAVLDGLCTNNILEAVLGSAIPEVQLACVAGKASAAIMTAVMNDPALVAKVMKQ